MPPVEKLPAALLSLPALLLPVLLLPPELLPPNGVALPPVDVSPEDALLPADALGAPPLVRVEPAAPALDVEPPKSLMTGGTRSPLPPPPTGGGWSSSPHADAIQAMSTNRGGTLPFDGNVTRPP